MIGSIKPRILLAAGGTGGHLFPAEALARELIARGCQVELATDARGRGFGEGLGEVALHRVSAGGIAGKGRGLRLANLARLGRGFVQSLGLILRRRPDCVIGFGGYASVPVLLAAQCLRRPTLLHEQNAVIGRANRFLMRGARLVALSFKETRLAEGLAQAKRRYTGNPVRASIAALGTRGYRMQAAGEPFHLLVMGGSQGARALSNLVPEAVAALSDDRRRRLAIAQQCRIEDISLVGASYAALGMAAELKPFFADVPARLERAHLVISRAGASTIAELAAAGRPAILVPLPHSIDDHQGTNARAFAAGGGGWVVAEEKGAAAALTHRLANLLETPEALARAAKGARLMGRPNAASALADLVLALTPAISSAKSREILV